MKMNKEVVMVRISDIIPNRFQPRLTFDEEALNELANSMLSEVSSETLGEMVMNRLRELDEVSYVRFASVYREFRDVDTFLQELQTLIKGKGKRRKSK